MELLIKLDLFDSEFECDKRATVETITCLCVVPSLHSQITLIIHLFSFNFMSYSFIQQDNSCSHQL